MSCRHTAAAAVLACCAAAAVAAPPKYAITLVDALPGETDNCEPDGINDRGQIVGTCTQRAYVWTPGVGIQELSAGPGLTTGAEAINSAGKVTGQAWNASISQAYIWEAGVGFQLLGGLDPADPQSKPYAINDADQVVGQSQSAEHLLLPFVWSPTEGLRTLVKSPSANGAYVYDINNLGVSAGWQGSTPNMAYRVDAAGRATRLRPPKPNQSAAAYALNDLGQVVGSIFPVEGPFSLATLWSESGVPLVIDRRTQPKDSSVAYDVNNAGQVVGTWHGKGFGSAFYWDAVEGLHDLNALLDPADPLAPSVRIYENRPRINNAGQIAVGALLAGNQRTLLLTPVMTR